jgi:Mlc titration factor MtfA (ptsG expression regulator)
MKVLVGATIAKLTFGMFENFWMPLYEDIGFYPKVFYSRYLDTFVKGLTSPRGNILLSREDFEKGSNNKYDKLDLGLHEFAHAYYFSYLHEKRNKDFYLYKIEARWIHLDMKNNILDKDFYLRDYAAANEHEFWAVSIEHYFENPFGFYKAYPRLYILISKVLQLDIRRIINENHPELARKYEAESIHNETD